MLTEKDNIKKELDAIKNNIEKKLADKKTESSKKEVKKTSKKKTVKEKRKTKVAPLITKIEVEKSTSKKKIEKKEKPIQTSKKKKKKFGLIPIAAILLLIASLIFIFSLKNDLEVNKKEFEEKSRKEKIDFDEDRYFKEVPDEIEDEELQDFAVYKDVPEVIVDNNNTKQPNITSEEQKNIDTQINNSNHNFSNNTAIKNNNNQNIQTTNSVSNNINTVNSDTKIQNNTNTELNSENSKKEKKKTNRIPKINSDYVKIIGLQHKDDRFILPKKAKRINSFKVRTRLNKTFLAENPTDVEVMLVIKNSIGKTLKIDTKTINFEKSKSKIMYIEFYETFSEKLIPNTEYSFSIFVNKELIKISKKRI